MIQIILCSLMKNNMNLLLLIHTCVALQVPFLYNTFSIHKAMQTGAEILSLFVGNSALCLTNIYCICVWRLMREQKC